MNTKQTIATGFLTLIAFGTLAFMPANADALREKQDNSAALVLVPGGETPQHLVWDMTYGDLTPPAADDQASIVAETAQEDVRDLSMG
jgi:hypothetical protein